ncbi:hypothetical protein MITS9509_02385 [Synechococcus sp. MIT S9509]|nr:hypothetical protein MITS9509_02385 [Synechococcus sp. MIT S9509]
MSKELVLACFPLLPNLPEPLRAAAFRSKGSAWNGPNPLILGAF